LAARYLEALKIPLVEVKHSTVCLAMYPQDQSNSKKKIPLRAW